MGGTSVFRIRDDDPNRNVIIETVSRDGARTVMAQRFIPEIVDGDKRVLLIAGEPVPYALARIPEAGRDARQPRRRRPRRRAAADAARPRDRAALGPKLAAEGLLVVGLDVIGEHLTEVNVTSPTCFVEITEQTGFDVAAMFADALVARARRRPMRNARANRAKPRPEGRGRWPTQRRCPYCKGAKAVRATIILDVSSRANAPCAGLT